MGHPSKGAGAGLQFSPQSLAISQFLYSEWDLLPSRAASLVGLGMQDLVRIGWRKCAAGEQWRAGWRRRLTEEACDMELPMALQGKGRHRPIALARRPRPAGPPASPAPLLAPGSQSWEGPAGAGKPFHCPPPTPRSDFLHALPERAGEGAGRGQAAPLARRWLAALPRSSRADAASLLPEPRSQALRRMARAARPTGLRGNAICLLAFLLRLLPRAGAGNSGAADSHPRGHPGEGGRLWDEGDAKRRVLCQRRSIICPRPDPSPHR